MLAVTNDVEVVKRFGGWKSDAIHAYLYTDLAAAPSRSKDMLASRPVLQPQQYSHPSGRAALGTRAGGPSSEGSDTDSQAGGSAEGFDVNWEASQAHLEHLERTTGLTFIQRVRLRRQLEAGGIVDPPPFLCRFGAADKSSETWLTHVSGAAFFAPASVPLSPAEAAPPTGMGNRQLREWIQEWGSAWDFLGLAPGSAMSEVLRAYKRTAIRLHPDKSPGECQGDPPQPKPTDSARQYPGCWRDWRDSPSSLECSTGWRLRRHRPPPWLVESGASAKGPADKLERHRHLDVEPARAPRHAAQRRARTEADGGPGPFYDSSSEEFDSAGPDTESSGPEIDRYPRIRCGRITDDGGMNADLANTRDRPSGIVGSRRAPQKARMATTALENPLEAKGLLVMENLHADLRPVDVGEQEKLLQGMNLVLRHRAPPKEKIPTKAPPPSTFNNTMRWICGGCGEPNGLHRYGCNGCGRSQHAVGNVQERATHWICPDCQEEVSVKANQCVGCGCWRPRYGVVLNRRDTVDGGPGLAVAQEAHSPPPGLDRDEQMDGEPQAPPPSAAATTPQPPPPIPTPEPKSVYFAKKGLGKGKGMGAPPEEPLPHTPAAPKSYAPGDFASGGLQPVCDPPHGPAPKKARGPTMESRPMAIVARNGEALWFTVRDLDETTPRLVLPWTIFQHVVMCRRALCGLQSWGRVGVIFIRRVAQDILHWARRRGHMTRIQMANSGNPCFMDLQEAHPEPQGDLPPLSPATECDGAMQILGDEPAVPPDEGAPPTGEGKGDSAPSSTSSGKGTGNTFKRATHWYCKRSRPKDECVVSDEEEEEDDVALNEEELEEGTPGEPREQLKCGDGTAQLRGQKGKGGSSNVKVRATNETARNDPKYMEDLDAGVSMAVAFQRHRSRLRAVQHQVAQGNVALQPRATPSQTVRALPPMMSLGRSHRLYLLNRLERLERQGVTWTQDEVGNCYTMEQFLDYLEARVDAEAERAEPTTASKSAGAPPPSGVPPPSGPTASTSTGTSSAPSGTTADGRPEPPSHRPDPAQDQAAGRPVDPDHGHDQPEAHPSAPSATSEGGEAAGDTAPAENDLPADDSARRSAVDGFHL
ncbi:unnamed protein product [Symbiodinium sp. CCMP2592]|nr:unnamed protein product [Symbiodinium sp. CCMP2592]